jgi:hypothetical protein
MTRDGVPRREGFMAWVNLLRSAQTEPVQRDPLSDAVKGAVCGKDSISTAALLDLLGLSHTTGNARRISKTMRSLGYVPIKSRKLMPGGFRDTVARGWARPVRKARNSIPSDLPAIQTSKMGG